MPPGQHDNRLLNGKPDIFGRMKSTLTFKTSINCGGCVAAVTPILNQLQGVKQWSVDTNHASKLLTIETEADNNMAPTVTEALAKAGYKAELVEG